MSAPFETYQTLEEHHEQEVENSLAKAQSFRTRSKKKHAAVGVICICLIVSCIAGVLFVRSKLPVASQQKSSANLSSSYFAAVRQSNADQDTDCIGDKLQNEVPLQKGEYICTKDGKYMVGFGENGNLVWIDNSQENKIGAPYYHQNIADGSSPEYLMLEQDGSIDLFDSSSNVVWTKNPIMEVEFHEKCLHETYSCPLLQLNSDGVLVVRWLDTDENWVEHKLYKVYGDGSDDGTSTSSPQESIADQDKETTTSTIPDAIAVHHVESAFQCVGERLSNETPIKVGEFLCSPNKNYVAGLTLDGHLVWMDLVAQDVKTYHNNTGSETQPFHFILGEKGSFILKDSSNKEIWHKKPTAELNITHKSQCLDTYNCPFLHLHNDGILVLSWMESNTIVTHDVRKVFGFFEETENVA